jgi:hypothetical protein
MVERPIKKADRQPKSVENESVNVQGGDEPNSNRSSRDGSKDGRNKKDRKDKRGSREEVKAPVNLALVRGPKPTKPQVAIAEAEVSEVPEVTEEVVADS